jgi:hypothetical protein
MSVNGWERAERLRNEDAAVRSALSRRDRAESGGPDSVLAKTKTVGTYPTTAGKFFACQTVKLQGTEAEGSTGVKEDLGDTFMAYLPVGAPVPVSGAEVVCTRVAHRWVIDY